MRRYKRSYRKRGKSNKDKLIFILLFGIISPVVAITLGFFLVKYIIYPQFVNNDYKSSMITEEKSDEEQNKLDLNIFNIQTGSFNDLNNANAHKDSLNSKNIPAYVVKLDNYKVFSGTFLEKKDAEEFKQYLNQSIEETFLHENIIEGKKTFDGELKEEELKKITGLIESYNEFYISETSIWKKALISKNPKDIKAIMDKNDGKLAEIHVSLNIESEITKKINVILESRKKTTKELEKDNIISSYSNYTKTLIDYINIIRVKKE